MEWRVTLADLNYGKEEALAVRKVLESRWLSMGQITMEFEEKFAAYLGVKHALAVSNGTVGLHLACLSLGIGAGDEVILPSLTFVATANAVLYTGASVRFADIRGTEDLNIDPKSIRSCITDKTKAIMVMHYGGYACAMDEIRQIATEFNLNIIEDAAHAPGASLNGKMLGTLGDVASFSFFANKNLATGEGGMLVTDRDDLAAKARLLRSHGMTSLTWDRHKGHAYTYDVVALGYNYRLDEIRSALGIEQLAKLDDSNRRRSEIVRLYRNGLADTSLEMPFDNHSGESAHHLFPILLPSGANRKRFIDSMRNAGIQTSIHYPPIHQFQYYKMIDSTVRLPKTEAIASREVTLPLYPGMTDEMTGWVIDAVKQALSE